jgi:enoyl-CoA hydratase/carnithine racemase
MEKHSSKELVTYELEGKVALIGLNRPEKRNALNEALVRALGDAIDRAADEAAAVVLFGHGPGFSSGLDLAELAARLAPDAPFPRRRPRHLWHETFDRIARGYVPVVAALHGAIVGGGLELAAAAHIRVADETAYFGLPEGQRGIFVGGGGSVRVQRIVGYPTMADMMLTGRIYSAKEAVEIRLAQYLVEPGAAVAKARELAHRIAENSQNTNWMIMNVLPRMNDMSHDDGLFMESLNSAAKRPPESLDRLKQFLDKKAKPLEHPKKD